jgi:hypothetical protein
MKNSTILLLNFFFVFTLSVSTIAQLTPSQLKEYNKQKLSLEDWKVGHGSYGGGQISYSSSTRWAAYQGFDRISESQFYSITGFDVLAEQARIRDKRHKIFSITKWSTLGTGLVLVFAIPDNPWIGCGLLVPALVFSIADLTLIGNLKPFSVASGMVDDYNLQLSITIKKTF